MDGAQARHLHIAVGVNAKPRRVRQRGGTVEAYPVRGSEGATSANLGKSSD